MYYVQSTYYGFITLDVIMLIIAVFKICAASAAKKKGTETAQHIN